MMRARLLVAASVLLVAFGASGDVAQRRPIVSSSSAGTDYTATAEFCWFMGDDGSSGEALADKCPTGNNTALTAGGSPTYAQTAPSGSPVSNAAVLIGSDNATLADSNINGGTDFAAYTMMAWVIDRTNGGDKAVAKSTYAYIETNTGATPPHTVRMRTPTTTNSNTSVTIDDTKYWHLAYTYDGATGNGVLYINGVSAATSSGGPAVTNDANGFAVGSDHSGSGSFWAGEMYEIVYDDSAWTQAQVCEVVRKGMKGISNEASRIALIGGSSCE